MLVTYLMKKFKFNQLNYASYCRFLELLHDDRVNCKFVLTCKKNYINSIKKRGITTRVNYQWHEPHKITENHIIISRNRNRRGHLKVDDKLSRFVPYFKAKSCGIFLNSGSLTRDVIPKTFKDLSVRTICGLTDVDKVFDLCYHENIKCIESYVHKKENVLNVDEILNVIQYLINKMPAEEHTIKNYINNDEILDFLPSLKKNNKINEFLYHGKCKSYAWFRHDSGERSMYF